MEPKRWYVLVGSLLRPLRGRARVLPSRTRHTWTPLPFQVWLFHQNPESLNPLSKYLSATTGFGSNYVTTQKVNVFAPLRGEVYTRPLDGCPENLPWDSLSPGITRGCLHFHLLSPASGHLHVLSPPNLLSPSFPLTGFCCLSLKSQLVPQPPGPFSRVPCLLPVLCRARSAWAPLCECEPCDEPETPFPAAGRRSVSTWRVGRDRKCLSAWS